MKTYKNKGFGPRKSKKGFTLIELLIVMVILAILAGVVVMAVGGVFGTSRERAYDVTKGEIENAVAHYASENNGALPALTTTVGFAAGQTTCSGNACNMINMSALVIANGGLLKSIPASSNASTPDAGSYVWVIDGLGTVYSACTGTACEEAGSAGSYLDGFKAAYP